ncbi:MAG: peptidase family protein [Thermoleophilia bacterium]|nr:peptidase family protein [Thermoleophilia bacterium]
MTIAIAQPARTGNPGIVPPWLQGPRPITPNPTTGEPTPPAPQPEVPTAATRDALVAVPLSNGQIVIVDVPAGMFPGGTHEAPTSRRGFGAVEGARGGVNVQREQQRIDDTVASIQAAYTKLGITQREGNDPVKAYFRPDFPNAAYAPEGFSDYDLPADSIGVGIDPRSGHSFAEAPDVVAHELAHRIIDHMTPSKLSMSPLSEDVAVHESLADTFAAMVDTDDWTMGEQLVEPVRIMDHPERLGHPGHVNDLKTILVPGGEHMVQVGTDRRTGEIVEAPDWHIVAGIPNKAAAIIGTELGRAKMGEIYLKAVRENVRPGQEVEGLAVAVLQSAKDLYGAGSHEFQVTKDAWDAVGVLDLLKDQAAAAPRR